MNKAAAAIGKAGDADGLFVDKQHVVSGAGIGMPFANGLADAGVEVDFLLHRPASLAKLLVNPVAGFLFGILVVGHWEGRGGGLSPKARRGFAGRGVSR